MPLFFLFPHEALLMESCALLALTYELPLFPLHYCSLLLLLYSTTSLWEQTKKKVLGEKIKIKILKKDRWRGGVWRKGWCFHVIKGPFRGLFCLNLRFLLGGHEVGKRATASHGSLTREWMISGSLPPLTPFPFTLLLSGIFRVLTIITDPPQKKRGLLL